MTLSVVEHPLGTDLRPFLDAARAVFEGDAAYVAPLRMEIEERLDPRKNPFFEHGEAAAAVDAGAR